MTDDFAALMAGSGVRRIAASPPPPVVRHPVQQHRPVAKPVAWVRHNEATTLLTQALQRLDRDLERAGKPVRGQIVVMTRGRGGALVDEGDPVHIRTAAALIDHADARSAEMVVIVGDTWKLVLHPGSGAATLAEDPS